MSYAAMRAARRIYAIAAHRISSMESLLMNRASRRGERIHDLVPDASPLAKPPHLCRRVVKPKTRMQKNPADCRAGSHDGRQVPSRNSCDFFIGPR
jgi:hypothetical protein